MHKNKAKYIRWVVFVLALVSAFPLPVKHLNGILIWSSPLVLTGRTLSNYSFHWLNILGIVTLFLIILQKRWICRYLCPLGVICDAGSKIKKSKPIRIRWKVNQILAVIIIMLAAFGLSMFMFLDPFSIFYSSMEFLRTGWSIAALIKLLSILFLFLFSIFAPNVWCASLCPLGGFQDLMYKLMQVFGKKIPDKKVLLTNTGRRSFLAALAGGTLGVILSGIMKKQSSGPIRPPFSLSEEEFCVTCIRCGNCSAVCPTHIIRPDTNLSPVEKFLCPEIQFNDSYCLSDCNNCGQVCPSGAIQKFQISEKADYKMADIKIILQDCLLLQNKECTQCKLHCSYNAISFKQQSGYLQKLPEMNPDSCTGCAECVVACPTRAISVFNSRTINQV